MYALFFSTTQVSLLGGTTQCTGWKNRVMSAVVPDGSGDFGGSTRSFTTFSAFFKRSWTLFCRTPGCSEGKLVWLAVMASRASNGDLLVDRISSFRAASSGLLYGAIENPATNFCERSI